MDRKVVHIHRMDEYDEARDNLRYWLSRPRSASRRSMSSDASSMGIPNDFKELLELFNRHKVEYLIVIGREDFIANKRETGRTKDAADIEALGTP